MSYILYLVICERESDNQTSECIMKELELEKLMKWTDNLPQFYIKAIEIANNVNRNDLHKFNNLLSFDQFKKIIIKYNKFLNNYSITH
tara:strand:+ start:51 stop:314 length:264 start_codon:yes stop_codon:yes gene_type:complete